MPKKNIFVPRQIFVWWTLYWWMETKICNKCRKEKILTKEFWKGDKKSKTGLTSICRDCYNEYRRLARAKKAGYYATERERNYWQHLTACRNLYYRYKEQVFAHYCDGKPKCAKCGFDNPKALSVDHINGKGNEHRKTLGGVNIIKWIVKNNFPEDFQILCMNCQFIKRHEEVGYEKWRSQPNHKYWDHPARSPDLTVPIDLPKELSWLVAALRYCRTPRRYCKLGQNSE